MNSIVLEILPLARQGFCCSQLLLLLLLRGLGRENAELIRAAHGLCHGMGGSEGPCGLLTGGACVLGYTTGKGTASEQPHPSLNPLLNDYQQWFAERTRSFGGAACHQVMQGLSTETGTGPPQAGEAPSPALCGPLFAECWDKILELLEAYHIEMERR